MLSRTSGSSYPSMRRFIVPAAPVAKAFDAARGRHHFDAYLSLLGVVSRARLATSAVQSLLHI